MDCGSGLKAQHHKSENISRQLTDNCSSSLLPAAVLPGTQALFLVLLHLERPECLATLAAGLGGKVVPLHVPPEGGVADQPVIARAEEALALPEQLLNKPAAQAAGVDPSR